MNKPDPTQTVYFRRARFSCRLPADRLYTPSHYWLLEDEPGIWRVGFTKFALRMLGEVVELGFQVTAGDPVNVGQTIGSVEGFKSLSDLYCVANGSFIGSNPALDHDISLIDARGYADGWLYRVRGTPEPNAVDVQGYV